MTITDDGTGTCGCKGRTIAPHGHFCIGAIHVLHSTD
jgi:hypothetical protein